MLEERGEDTVLVMYGDHLPGFKLTEEDLGGTRFPFSFRQVRKGFFRHNSFVCHRAYHIPVFPVPPDRGRSPFVSGHPNP